MIDVDSDDPLAAALGYAALCWRVVPTPPESKHPRFPAWQDIASGDAVQITDWWGRFDGDGISIVCGPSGLVVLDIDRHGADGEDTLADLCATYGKLPDTPCVLTGGGGRHLYFAAPPGVTITNDAGRRLGPGLDIRAQGGQVVAPPSLHASGQRYQWEASSLPCLPSALFDPEPGHVPLAPLPDWLVELLTKSREDRPLRPLTTAAGNGHLPGQQWAAVTAWADLLTRDGATFLGRRTDHRTGGTYEVWARPGVSDHVSATLGYGGSDVLKVFSTEWPDLDPEATYTKFGYFAATRHGGNFADARAALEAEGFTIDLARLIATPAASAEPLSVLWGWLSALMQEEEPVYDWLVDDLIERGDRIITSGDEGMGKSTLGRQIGLAAAAGINPFGQAPFNRHAPRTVLLVDCENSRRQLRREFPKVCRALDEGQLAGAAGRLAIALRTEGLCLDDRRDREGDREWLKALVAEVSPDLLVIGPLYKLFGGDPTVEHEAREVARFLDALRGENAGMAVVIEAHAPHDAKRPFGWSGWKRWPEFGFHLSADGSFLAFRGGRDSSRHWPKRLRRGGDDEWPWLPDDVAPERPDRVAEATDPEGVQLRVQRVMHELYRVDPERWFTTAEICDRAVGTTKGRLSQHARRGILHLTDRGWLDTRTEERKRGLLTSLSEVYRWADDGPGGDHGA